MGSNAIDILIGGGRPDDEFDDASDEQDSGEQDELADGEPPAASYSPFSVSQNSSPARTTPKSTLSQGLLVIAPARYSDNEYEDYDEPGVISGIIDESIRSGNERYLVEFTSGDTLWVCH